MNRFLSKLSKHGNATAMVDSTLHTTTNYTQLLDSSARVRDVLKHKVGLKQGQRVGILAQPGTNFTSLLLGAWRAGAIAVPICPDHTIPEQEYILNDSSASVILAPKSYQQAQKLTLPATRLVNNMEDLLAEKTSKPATDTDACKDAALIYTSGSTGKPKGVVTSFDALHAMVDGMVSAWKWTNKDRILHFLPLHHVHGLYNKLLTPLAVGATVEFCQFDAKKILNRLAQHRDKDPVTIFMGVPTVYTKLINAYDKNQHKDMAQVRVFICGSAPLTVNTFEQFLAMTNHRILERYGMTEIGMGLSNPYDPPSQRLPGYVGRPMPGVQTMIQGDDGKPAAAGHSGQLLIKGTQVFSSYWGKPAEDVKKEFTEDGWFKTGDIAMLDPAVNSYKILGRASVDIIKVGGYKISAIDIEMEIMRHPRVSEVAVMGIPDAVYGEQIVAVVGVKDPANTPLPTEKELIDFVKSSLASYKCPRKVMILKEGIPRNAMQKINKKELRKLFG